MNNFLLAGDSDNSIFQFEINNTKENEIIKNQLIIILVIQMQFFVFYL